MNLELRVPPVIVLIVCGALMFVLAEFGAPIEALVYGDGGPTSPDLDAHPGRWVVLVSGSLAGAGILIALLGVREFRRAQTTVDPRYPERSTQLVTSGIYRWTRNPMYLGMALCLAATAVYLGRVLPWTVLPAFVLYMARYQIAPEERAMREAYGSDYEAFCGRVRRWL